MKVIPILKGDIAKTFIKRADDAVAKRATVDFRENSQKAKVILEKANLIPCHQKKQI